MICQISDNGHFTDRLVGLLPPQDRQGRARGLWMVYQLCDQVYQWTEPTIIRTPDGPIGRHQVVTSFIAPQG